MSASPIYQPEPQARKLAIYDSNEAGYVLDRFGNPRIAFRGELHFLQMLEKWKGAFYSSNLKALTVPFNPSNVSAFELLVDIDKAYDSYRQARSFLFLPDDGEKFRERYPQNPPALPDPMFHQIDALAYCDRVWKESKVQAPNGNWEKVRGFGQLSETGTGKTRWGADSLRHFGFRKTLVICKKIAITQWADEFEKHGFAKANIHVLSGKIESRITTLIEEGKRTERPSQPVVYITNWDVVSRLEMYLLKQKRQWELVLADETIKIANRSSQTSKTMFKLEAKSGYKLGLNGTLTGNSGEDIWSQYRFINKNLFGSFYQFKDRYLLYGGWEGREFQGFNVENLPELIQKIYSCSYRVVKAICWDMPEKLYRTVELEPSDRQARLYRSLSKELFAEITQDELDLEEYESAQPKPTFDTYCVPGYEAETSLVDAGPHRKRLEVTNALSKTLRLQQLTAGIFPVTSKVNDQEYEQLPEGTALPLPVLNGPFDVLDENDNEFDELLSIPQSDAGLKSNQKALEYVMLDNPKTRWVVEYCKDMIESDPRIKIAVWGKFKAEIRNLMLELTKALGAEAVGLIDGSVSQTKRDIVVKLMRDRESALKVGVFQISAAAYSLDLPTLDKLIYHSNTFSYVEREQSEGRGLRLMRERPYEIIDLVLSKTIDHAIMRSIRERRDMAKTLLINGWSRNIELPDGIYEKLEDPRVELEGLRESLFK